MEILRQDIDLDIDYAGLTYRGSTTLHLRNPPSDLTVNSTGLSISGVKGNGIPVACKIDPAAEGFLLSGLSGEEVRLVIGFSRRIEPAKLKGLYRSSYGAGYILTTQLAATDARSFIPCIDHPAMKTVFRMRVTVPEDLTVIFNTPILEETVVGGRKTILFSDTPTMSTYLLYLGVGHFEERTSAAGKVRLICATPPGLGDTGLFALEHAGRTLGIMESYFTIPYPLPKLHIIAVPEYEAGAMENWGAITFRESGFLIGPDSSTRSRRWCAEVIAHEMAHQWYGNLVTMKWWNDIWLNESFATFMGYKVADELHPEWELWSDFLVRETSPSFLWDSLSSTHPIDVHIERSSDITEAFDEISYGKGGSILRMLEAYLGGEAFRSGVVSYLNRYQYGNAEGQDLWRELDSATGEPISRIMQQWITRPGYPVLRVSYNGGKIVLEQERFSLDGKVDAEPWPIPLTMFINGKRERILMEGSRTEIVASHVDDLLVNAGRTGFYRVRYDDRLWSLLREKFSTLYAADRWGVIQDLFALTLAGEVTLTAYLESVQDVREDPSDLLVNEIMEQWAVLNPILSNHSKFTASMKAFVEAQLERIGRERRAGEPDTVRALRGKLLNALVYLDPAHRLKTSATFAEYDNLDPDVRKAVILAYSLTDGETAFRALNMRLASASNDEEATRMAMGLASGSDPALIRRALDDVLSGAINLTRGFDVILSALSNPYAQSAYWEWFQSSSDKLVKVLQGTLMLSPAFQYSLPYLMAHHQHAVKEFLSTRHFDGAEAGIQKGLALGRVYVHLLEGLDR